MGLEWPAVDQFQLGRKKVVGDVSERQMTTGEERGGMVSQAAIDGHPHAT